ncbi:unnamed protein product [marine sediment metagenome]|uniref:Uncharacterized protein n=1 Tax=marine sediment metagenome TaxID=412755 RepID=X1Q2N9_9ZZZZ
MNLPKAVEILALLERTLAPILSADGTDAIKLGEEAIKEIREERKYEGWPGSRFLPGETPEADSPQPLSAKREET